MTWSVEELVERVAQALAAGSVRSSNGRVGPLPDRRMIRWYATIGLVDRPLTRAGRVARYGRRHLLQLVAIKRRQAAGATLAEIQAELIGATDATLAAIANVPAGILDGAPAAEISPAPIHPAPTPTPTPGLTAPTPTPATGLNASTPNASTPNASTPDNVTTDASTAVNVTTDPSSAGNAIDGSVSGAAVARPRFWASPPTSQSRPTHPEFGRASTVDAPLYGVRLDDVVLLLPTHPGPDDLAAIRAAAQPLLDLLVHRGLSTHPGRSTA